jgi:hypothetical protein
VSVLGSIVPLKHGFALSESRVAAQLFRGLQLFLAVFGILIRFLSFELWFVGARFGGLGVVGCYSLQIVHEPRLAIGSFLT